MDWVGAATIVGGFATGVAAGVGIAALFPATRQFQENARIARETVALNAYNDYLRIAFENPEFCCAHLAAKKIGIGSWTGIQGKVTPESEKYLWYLSILLNAAEQIVSNVPLSDTWINTIRDQFRYHYSPLKEIWPIWQSHYEGDIKRLVDEVMTEEAGGLDHAFDPIETQNAKHFLLQYDYAPDYLERRGSLRPAHFEHAKASIARDELQLGGAMTDDQGPPAGVLMFKAESRATVEAFASADPYVLNKLVESWRVREWTTVVGRDALTKV